MQKRQESRARSESLSVPLACIVCRERHVKCDGRQPTCSRCLDSKQSCYYVQSRRGRRPFRKRDRSQDSSDSASSSRRTKAGLNVPDNLDLAAFARSQRSTNYVQQPLLSANTASPKPGLQATSNLQSSPNLQHSPSLQTPVSMQTSPAFRRSVSRSPVPTIRRLPGPPSVQHRPQDPGMLRELYYFYFHDSHPILIPQLYLPQISQSAMPAPVEAAMHYIGSQYSRIAKNDPQYLLRLQECLFTAGSDRNRFTVQAMVLLGIIQRAQDRNDLALDTFNQAIDLAVQLGMNRASFAQDNSEGSVIIQEMWRRVWWELYINDALLAEVRQGTFFRTHSIEKDVSLPWEEDDYRNCRPGISHQLKDIENMAFYDDEAVLSSFSYRIAAARNINTLLKLNQAFCPNSAELVASLDLAVSNWQLHLPDRKRTPVDREGRADEMMFQAHLMINSTSICLHRPRSNLIFTSIQDASTITPSSRSTSPTARHAGHTVKAIQAADRISNLMMLPGESIRHSPLFTYAVTLSAVVHLSAYVLSEDFERSALIRDRIALSTGALRGLRYTWPLATGVLQHLRIAAKEVMTYGQANITAPVITDSVNYDVRAMAVDPWLSALHDPLFTQIPDLLQEDVVAVTLGMQDSMAAFTQ